MEIRESDVRAFAKAKIEKLESEIQKWKRVIDALGDSKEEQPNLFHLQPEISKINKKAYIPSDRVTIREKAINVIKGYGCPVTSTEIMESMNKLYPDKIYNMNSFSGAFSSMYTKTNSGINSYPIRNATPKLKVVYGLTEWFIKDKELKPEYLEQVKHRYGTI